MSKRMYVLETTNFGPSTAEFATEPERAEYLMGCDDTFEDFYCLDVFDGDGGIDFYIAVTGEHAMEDYK